MLGWVILVDPYLGCCKTCTHSNIHKIFLQTASIDYSWATPVLCLLLTSIFIKDRGRPVLSSFPSSDLHEYSRERNLAGQLSMKKSSISILETSLVVIGDLNVCNGTDKI